MLNTNSLQKLAKVELHRHLEGSLRLTTLQEISGTKNIAEARRKFQVLSPMKNLKEVIDCFLQSQKLLNSYEIIERMSFEACEDAALENTRVLELRYAPSFLTLGHALDWQQTHEAILRGARRAESLYPIAVGFIGIIVRSMPLSEAEKSLQFFLDNKDSFLAMDLADQEVGFDCKTFTKLFEKAKAGGLHITVHSGEEKVPGAASFVKDSIDYLGAERIGHGIQIVNDNKIMEYVREKKVMLELCPTSNFLTSNVASLKQHPFRHFMEYGIPVSLNSDDPGIFGIDLSNEFEVLQREQNFMPADFQKVTDMALKYSFIPKNKIAKVWDK